MAEAAVESPQPETSAGMPLCSSSPPPNCAICLGGCINKCFSDSCMHQFCFKCLLEWSKVKAVCPLCKQPFKSIIHNVKSNEEYDQHFVPQPTSSESRFEDMVWRDRQFQFRTTFTVDPRGELAIQHLLSTRSMNDPMSQMTRMNIIRHLGGSVRTTGEQRTRDVSSTQYRRSLYERNLHTYPMTDVTGRYRETSPGFYSEYPGSKNRLVPFLLRELNALLPDDRTLHAMNLVHRILAAVDNHPIRGRYMKELLRPEMGANTEHFLYEFYTYARSPYDLYGYDRHSQVLAGEPHVSEESSDSDVLFVSSDRAPARTLNAHEVIEIGSESSRDSDVVVREPTPPITVDLAHTTTSGEEDAVTPPLAAPPVSGGAKRARCRRAPSTSSACTSSEEEEAAERRARAKRRPVLVRARPQRSSRSEPDCSSEEVDARPRRKILRKKKHARKTEPPIKHETEHAEHAPPPPPPAPSLLAAPSASGVAPQPQPQDYLASRLDAAYSGYYQRDFAAGLFMGDYNGEQYGLVQFPKLESLPAYYGEQPYAAPRYADQPGPSGVGAHAHAWQTKPCSDSD